MITKSITKNLRLAAILSVFTGIATIIGCNNPIEGIERGNPPLEAGSQKIVVNTTSDDASALSNYTVKVTDPSGTDSELAATSGTLEIGSLSTGNYTIEVIKDGYVGQSGDLTVELPEDESSDYEVAIDLELTKLADPVPVDNSTGGQVGTNSGGRTNAVTMVLDIPGNAIPGTGTTDIGLTALPVLNTNPNDPSSFAFAITPLTLTLTQPSTITFDLPQALINLGVSFILKGVDGTEVPVTVDAANKQGSADITKFGIYGLALDVSITKTADVQTRSAQGNCGEDLNTTVEGKATMGAIFAQLKGKTNRSLSKTVKVQKSGQPFFQIKGTASIQRVGYTITSGNATIESGFSGFGGAKVEYSSKECHDSGG
ncbi:hypothetical protein [Marinoscillum furvescens]|uniref:Carboxypeptidase family protein n=1 Tax=Marinoscillum furvescens DSM 4134 TaxID=1122208 RepID=A0A3D9L0W4_MARFU|nr:hypothetical protein [Marinoscillum furvescens]RED96161.1 hypothetical protein C7460_11550 [Marinoscillum furvescens DSM 4134]